MIRRYAPSPLRRLAPWLLASLLSLTAAGAAAEVPAAADTGGPLAVNVGQVLKDLPDGQRWLRHLREDLLPFWTMPSALGKQGDFPTYRCDDGSLPDPKALCAELRHPVPGIVWLDREFVRAKARQVYAYGVAFHLTGDRALLGHARDGVEFLRRLAVDREHGGVISYWLQHEDGSWSAEPAAPQRRSQDMAYALSGLGFYYYLTRDEEVLQDILKIKEYLFATYYDPQWQLLAWVKAPSPDGDRTDQRELVAQLDQVYGYMLWLAPTLPEPHRGQWYGELTRLAHSMIEQFYSPRVNLFWGAVTDAEDKQLGRDHVDFGHSVKTLWLIYQIGKLTGDTGLVTFASERAARILDAAYLEDDGTWGRRIDAHGRMDRDKEWWILAELDQVAATLALVDPAYARYLPSTSRYWFDTMVDHRHGGVWHMVSGTTHTPVSGFPKQHSWKNAFHTFEHALVGYLTAQALHGEPIVLHYAFRQAPPMERVHPYLYQAKLSDLRDQDGVQAVTFTALR